MPESLGFDVYGTLVDPLEMSESLRPLVGGDLADRFGKLWREKQVEYSFRRGLMREYENFDVCTRQALDHAADLLDVEIPEAERERLIEKYQNLSPYPDVRPGLEALGAAGHTLVAFSNGVEYTVRTLLERAGVLPHLEGVVSVDDLKTFKPDPEVYHYLARRLERPPSEVWLVSSNPFDIIGAKKVGLRAAWIKRRLDARFDPWGVGPDLVVSDLEELAEKL